MISPGNPVEGKNVKGFDMTAKISEILDLQHKEIMYALEQMKEAEKLIWKEAMAKAGFQINVLILLALALERHKSISVCKPF